MPTLNLYDLEQGRNGTHQVSPTAFVMLDPAGDVWAAMVQYERVPGDGGGAPRYIIAQLRGADVPEALRHSLTAPTMNDHSWYALSYDALARATFGDQVALQPVEALDAADATLLDTLAFLTHEVPAMALPPLAPWFVEPARAYARHILKTFYGTRYTVALLDPTYVTMICGWYIVRLRHGFANAPTAPVRLDLLYQYTHPTFVPLFGGFLDAGAERYAVARVRLHGATDAWCAYPTVGQHRRYVPDVVSPFNRDYHTDLRPDLFGASAFTASSAVRSLRVDAERTGRLKVKYAILSLDSAGVVRTTAVSPSGNEWHANGSDVARVSYNPELLNPLLSRRSAHTLASVSLSAKGPAAPFIVTVSDGSELLLMPVTPDNNTSMGTRTAAGTWQWHGRYITLPDVNATDPAARADADPPTPTRRRH